ncbi:tyrosine-type recombinase/integrase [Planctomycetota bacterium]
MASIYKRGKIWWIHYMLGDKSVSRSLKTSSERVALEKKKRFEALDVIGQLGQPSKTPIVPFLQSFCEFLEKTRIRKSAKNDISYLRSFFGPCCPALELGSNVPHKFRRPKQDLPRVLDRQKDRHIPVRRLEQISTEIVSRFIQERLTQDDIKPKTANRIREVLHRMFSYAIEHYGYVCPDNRYRNPIKGVKRIRESASAITWLTLEEMEKQLAALKDHPVIHALVSVYIYAGLRREEALWLTRNDVDLGERLIRVQAKTINGEYWQPKTKRNRVVPISNTLFEILSEHTLREHCIWFFPSSMGKRWNPDNFSQDLREINEANDLGWTCLDFRHTFGSHLAQRGVSLYKISTLMGNSPEICRRHYAALVPEEMKSVVEFAAQKGTVITHDETNRMLCEILDQLHGDKRPSSNKPNLKLVHFDSSA